MSELRAPLAASAMILCLLHVGRGRPFRKSPPSWFTPLGPGGGAQGWGSGAALPASRSGTGDQARTGC